MSRTYHIDGTQEFGYSTVNRYLYSYYSFTNTVKRVCELYNNASVHDLNGYAAHFCYRRVKAFHTFTKIVVEHKDYITSNCVLRMLGDSVSVFHLVYMEKNPHYRWLRHALYVLEGCEKNMEVLRGGDFNKEAMPEEEFEIFKQQLNFNVELRKRLMFEAQQIIDTSPLKLQDEAAFKKIVKDRNWKFKEFKNYKNIKENQYSWHELYEKIGRCEHFDLLTYISQYVHALSMSNLVMEMNVQNRDGLIAEALGLINKLNDDVLLFFSMNYPYIMDGFLAPDMRDKILSCYDDEHRPDLSSWETRISNCKKAYYDNGRMERI